MRIYHQRYGDPEVVKANPMGSHYVVWVNFSDHGPRAIVLATEDVSVARQG